MTKLFSRSRGHGCLFFFAMRNPNKRIKTGALLLLVAPAVALCFIISPTVFTTGASSVIADDSSGAQWMKSLDGDESLAQLSIPGTHNSGARFEPIRGTAQCQNLTIPDQLNAGVRFLDIRCRHRNDAFDIYHGPIYQHQNFADVVNSVADFLRAHPSETVIVSVQQTAGARDNTRSFEATFDATLANTPAAWLLDSTVPTLNQARGKIVLLRRFKSNKPLGIDASMWPDNQAFETDNLRVQDIYNVSDSDAKWQAIESLLNQTRADDATTPLTLNFASGVKPLIFGIPNVIVVANDLNLRLARYFAAKKSGNLGVVIVDFADEKLCAAIYKTNGEPQK